MPVFPSGYSYHKVNGCKEALKSDRVEINGLPRADIAEVEVSQEGVGQEEGDEDSQQSSTTQQGGCHCDEQVLKNTLQS